MHQKEQKQRNLKTLLEMIRTRTRISQAKMAQETGLQPSTVSNLVKVLKQYELLIQDGKGESGKSGGRKSNLLSVNPGFGCFGGIYIRSHDLLFFIIDFAGNILDKKTLHVPEKEQEVVDLISSEIQSNILKYPSYKGTGIAVSSVINQEGDITVSADFSWSIPHFLDSIQGVSPELPLVAENDANCSAFYSFMNNEARFSSLMHFVVYRNPFQIGSGIILDGKVYTGNYGAAGEIWESNPERPFENTNESDSIDQVRDIILSASSLVDTQAVFVSGDMKTFDPVLRTRFETDLKKYLRAETVEVLESDDSPVLGAALIASNIYINHLLKGD